MANCQSATSSTSTAVLTLSLIFLSCFYFIDCAANPGDRNRFEENGFINIGNMSGDQVANGVNSIGTQTISLYLSGANDRKTTQMEAIQQCKKLWGELLFVLNENQYQDVRQAIHGLGEPFWTSAVYDPTAGNFVWFANGITVNNNFIRTEARCTERNLLVGLSVQGSLSSYGLCSARTDSALRYICRV
ncbi:unnamed protein product [Orchesella dallaii]|uniref:C-type lectin domain-containing protein n=1 Tax=Orchesella dallaii TaxID=48710 RepID=A0ABP1QLV8_9HEXA